jgi:hypothetical protein
MIMKKTVIIVLGLSFLFSLTGCSNITTKQLSSDNTKLENKNIRPESLALAKDSNELGIKTTLDVLKEYKTIDELVTDSNIIIKGVIQDAKITFNTSGIYTNTKIQVIDNLEGILKPNDVINITFRGGTINGEDAKKLKMDLIKEKYGTIDNDVKSDKIEEIVNGLDNFKTGDKLLLFLEYRDNQYFVTGSYQGRFKLSNDVIQLPEEFKEKYKNVKNEDFIGLTKNSISKKKELK